MMWLSGAWQRFRELLPSGIPASAVAQLAALNPDRIYLENVRSILGVSSARAKNVCDTAVRRGVFTKRFQVICPDGSVAVTAERESDLPPLVRCWHDEEDFEMVPTRSLQRLEVYSFRG